MSKVNKDAYEKIVKIHNESGIKAAMEYIEINYGTKYPRDVLMRIKKSPGYSYDATSKKIIKNTNAVEKSIFIEIDELCKTGVTEKFTPTPSTFICNTKANTIEALYQELMQEKFVELSKYVRLNRYSNTISIDKTALIANGYHVAIY